ncbi:RING-H2 finger protein ATL46-like [Rutidosis leptorrhynchoides]|uniref:RING-H2 finger protein ATL46-like n=1 Tax=Rutidosis leptorrhynchoides TaxID=125765 RepID=UPI003A98DCCE
MRLLLSFSPPPVTPPITDSKTNSTLLFARNIIIVIAFMFFICGLLHLLVRYLMKRKRLSSSSSNFQFQSSRFQESGVDGDDDDAYDRQLRHLFNQHDSGLDQAFIDALPVFSYKELMGLKEPFDCAVCLCEFTQQDNLRLLPLCSHAFHMHCIDTWLLSNSSCPLCRGTLFSPGFSVENPVFEFNEDQDYDDQGYSGHFKQSNEGSIGNEKRVYPVRLGKFRATNVLKKEEKEVGETSSSNFDARRCYSMGSYEYVVGNTELKVAFVPNKGSISRGSFGNKDFTKLDKDKGYNSSIDGGCDGKKISNRSKGESFSVSKIWLWSKKDHHQKGQTSAGTHMVNSSVNVSLPMRNANNSDS